MWQLVAIAQKNHVSGSQPNCGSQDNVRDKGRFSVKEGKLAVTAYRENVNYCAMLGCQHNVVVQLVDGRLRASRHSLPVTPALIRARTDVPEQQTNIIKSKRCHIEAWLCLSVAIILTS
jgi:hypothetical protein